MSFKALIVDKDAEGVVSQSIASLEDSKLPDGNVTVDVSHSTLNYKDGLCITGKGGLVRNFPHIPGIDFAGTVSSSTDARYKTGDAVIQTGWRVGEAWWGGYATKASVNADWLVPMPDGMTARHAMAIGTAGFTSMLAVMSLEEHGLIPEKGEVLVTGAAGGVGSVAVSILSHLGYSVAAVTGRPETADYLKGLGADTIIPREELLEESKRPLESERWNGCVDAVGGEILGRVLKQMKYGGSVAAIGLAGGAAIPSFTVVPFLLRSVNLLGIDSVACPYERRVIAWNRLSTELPLERLEPMIEEFSMSDLPKLGPAILKGQVKGRAVIDIASAAS
ncbi:MAG: MDR family oxidoreductase [Hyphomicrobiales bacterium]